MKIVTIIVMSLLGLVAPMMAEIKENFQPINIEVHKDVSPSALRDKISEVCEASVKDFLKRNAERQSASIAIFPAMEDIDGMATEEVSSLLATYGQNKNFKVVTPLEVRKKLVEMNVQEQQLEGIIDESTVTELGKQLGCDVLLTPKLVVIDEWDRKDQKVTLEMLLTPWDAKKAIKLPVLRKKVKLVPAPAPIPEPTFIEQNGKMLLLIGAGLVGVILVLMFIGGLRKAARPRPR